MEVFISYKKGNKVKHLSNIEFTEFDMLKKKFFYWGFGGGEKPKCVNLKLVRDIKVNQTAV